MELHDPADRGDAWFLYLPTGAALAAAVVIYATRHTALGAWLLCACFLAGLGITLLPRCCSKAFGFLLLAMSMGLVVGAGVQLSTVARARKQELPAAELSGTVTLRGSATADSSADRRGVRAPIRAHHIASARSGFSTGVRVEARGRAVREIRWGQIVTLRGTLVAYGASKTGGGFSPATAPEYVLLVDESVEKTDRYRSALLEARASVLSPLLRREPDAASPSRGLFRALFFGVKEDLDPGLYEAFRRSGTIHALALSGMHLGILATLVALCVLPIAGRSVALACSFAAAVAYVALVGPRPSLVRALVMYGLGVYCLFRGRNTPVLNFLALSFLVLMLSCPSYAYTLSLKLSFLALAGILTVGRGFARCYERWIPHCLLHPLAASLGALVLTTPVVVSTFGVVYPVGILANLFVAPLITAFLVTGLFTGVPAAGVVLSGSLLGGSWLGSGAVSGGALSLLYDAIESVTWFFGRWPGLDRAGAIVLLVIVGVGAAARLLARSGARRGETGGRRRPPGYAR